MIKVGIDIGGTFTDLSAFNSDKKSYFVYKTPSIPRNPEQAVINALGGANISMGEIETIILGTLIGALAGAASAYLLVKRAETEDIQPKLSPGEGIQVGLGVLGLMRMIAGFGTN